MPGFPRFFVLPLMAALSATVPPGTAAAESVRSYPDIDLSAPAFEQGRVRGESLLGWWGTRMKRWTDDREDPGAPVEGVNIEANNYSRRFGESSIWDTLELDIHCADGRTLAVEMGVHTLSFDGAPDFEYSFDGISGRWERTTDINKHSALWYDTEAVEFLRGLYYVERASFLVPGRAGRTRWVEFEMAGIKEVILFAGGECFWPPHGLAPDDLHAIQELLSVEVFGAGKPDGIWSDRWRRVARTYQKRNDLLPTGELDWGTLEALGFDWVEATRKPGIRRPGR